ncbi:unnamed protein product [Schistosoma mattheei]|uniref:Macoilin n=1 Tax=Schistosoma mattheei TaxID=31246 RepID=A0A183NIS1_9TREM|nr:unnamed protein product [Schistosoma mattheei]
MPTRRKNVDLNRLKRSLLFVVNQSTDMRFEYFWPVWLSVCSIHDSLKFQGLQYTIVFIIILITVDLMCFFLIPASWIYTFGSAMNVRRQNYLHFRILYEALPPSSVNDNACKFLLHSNILESDVQHSLDYFQKDSLEVHEVAMSDDVSPYLIF